MTQSFSKPLPPSIHIESERDNKIIKITNAHASAKISLFGAQVLQFQPHQDKRERLWLSPNTKVDCSEAIRGGAPLCWPWFANQFPKHAERQSQLPSHGFLRSQLWQISHAEELESGTKLVFTSPNAQGQGFDYQASVSLHVMVGAALEISLVIENTDRNAFAFTGAIHTYFAVHDINQVQIHGINGLYIDKTKDMNTFLTPEEYGISTETDRIHQNDNKSVVISQTDIEAHTHIEQTGHDSIVVWNPWQQAKNISNMPDDAYRAFICVECAITNEKTLLPGETHRLTQIIN